MWNVMTKNAEQMPLFPGNDKMKKNDKSIFFSPAKYQGRRPLLTRNCKPWNNINAECTMEQY